LYEAIQRVIAEDPNFAASPQAGALHVLIPANVRWERAGQRTRVFSPIEFRFSASDSSPARTQNVSCWDDELGDCARQVLDAARAVVQSRSN
jgi:hypothetical protein